MVRDNFCRKAVVTNIVDGDTFDAVVDLGYSITTTQRYRLYGIDTPELKGHTRAEAEVSKKYLQELIMGKEVIVESTKTDSFGRYLANVYVQVEHIQINVTSQMIKKGMGVVR